MVEKLFGEAYLSNCKLNRLLVNLCSSVCLQNIYSCHYIVNTEYQLIFLSL